MSTLTWVAGGGGLLGSQVLVALRRSGALEPWFPSVTHVDWADIAVASDQLRLVAQELIRDAMLGRRDGWAIVWCAGAGVVGTPGEALEAEASLWQRFLDGLGSALDEAGKALPDGRIVLISSAGAVYGAGSLPFTEESPCRPVSPYGQVKVRQEQALASWASSRADVSTLVVRVSNLYGPAQKLTKPQGLISHMARSVIHGRPIHIFVPLDTVRDYLFAEDAGLAVAQWTQRLGEEAAGAGVARHVTKLCAAERDTTISAIVGVFRRIAHRRVRIVNGLHPVQALQPAQLRFRSKVWTEWGALRTGLLEGISRVYREQLSLYQAGLLAPPSAHVPLAASQVPRTKPIE